MEVTKVKSWIDVKNKGQKGITLIALVITIIILLILAGVSLNLVAGSNGIINKSSNAVSETQIATAKEETELFFTEAKIDYLNEKYIKSGENTNSFQVYLTSKQGEYTKFEIDVQGKFIYSASNGISITGIVDGDEVKIDGDVVYGDIPSEGEAIAKDGTTSYVGYYADIDGDNQPEGVIYADLAVGSNGSHMWNNDSWSNYEYAAEDVNTLKDYYVCMEEYDGTFGKADVLKATGTGADRFYVMALNDFDTSTHYWYYSAYGKLDGTVAEGYNDFGAGKQNTKNMINDWNNNTATYGAQNSNDLWGIIQNSEDYDVITNENPNGKWFVPSKAEWSAFGDYLYTKVGVTPSDYGDYGLSKFYWSSSKRDTYHAFNAEFNDGYIGNGNVDNLYYVRMGATF